MSNAVIAFLLAAGATTWLFNHFQNTSGRNTSRSIKAAGISGVIIFGVCWSILGLVF
jgi:hypothetical protein